LRFVPLSMRVEDLLDRALQQEFLTAHEGVFLFEQAPTADLVYAGHTLRNIKKRT